MGRGSVSTKHGQIKILKHPTENLLTYIQKAVQTGIYRSNEEIEEMNKNLKENPTDLRRVRWNVERGSKIQDYPREYEILSLNPPPAFKPRMPVKDQKKMYNKYLQENRPMDRLVNGYLQKEGQRSSGEPVSADDYYRRLLGSKKAPGIDSAMGAKSPALAKAYAVAVKQYHVMRTENLSEHEALQKVEELLAQEDLREKTTSRTKSENIVSAHISEVDTAIQRAQKAFPETMPKEHILESPNQKGGEDDSDLALLYSEDQRSFEGMINWTKRLQAVPYNQWSVGASVALDHWIAKRVLGLSEETWLALLEGDSPELMGRGRDIVMARRALFPETVLDAQESILAEDSKDEPAEDDENLDELLATLAGWSAEDKTNSNADASLESFSSSVADDLQSWRAQHHATPFDDWPQEKKQKFNYWLQTFVSSHVPETSLGSVDLEETRKNLLEPSPQNKDSAYDFWGNLRDETSAEIFLQKLRQDNSNEKDHPFWDLDYGSQLRRLVNLGTISEIANEYSTETQRSKFLSRYGDYLLEGVSFDHLVLDPSGPISGSDLGPQLQEKYEINHADRFSLQKILYGKDEFGSEASQRARVLYKAWNKLKTGRAHYEEKQFQRGLLGLTYDEIDKSN